MNSSAQVATAGRKKHKGSKSRLRLWLQLLKSTKQIEAELRERLRSDFGSTLPRFDVLAALDRFDAGLRMSELSDVLRVSNGNVTGIVDRLVEEGMVSRASVDGDRRALRVALTKKGKEQFALLAAEHESWVNQLLSSISATDAEALITQLQALRTADTNEDK